MLEAKDVAVLRAAKAQTTPTLWDAYGYPARHAVESLAKQLQGDAQDIYVRLKYLKSLDAFSPDFNPRRPLKREGILGIGDRIANGKDASSIDVPRIRKTEAYWIIDNAITEHLSAIPSDRQEFTKAQMLDAVSPLLTAMRKFATMFPNRHSPQAQQDGRTTCHSQACRPATVRTAGVSIGNDGLWSPMPKSA